MNTITLENYRQFKPSDLIARGVHDMFDAIEAGHDIITHDWFGYNEVEEKCFCCLGGAVLRGMVPLIKDRIDCGSWGEAKSRFMFAYNDTERNIAILFDAIRRGSADEVIKYLKELYNLRRPIDLFNAVNNEWKMESFYGQLNKLKIEKLSKSIFSLVDALRSIGL